MATERALISKTALRKLPARADDGTPYCPSCRTYGELNRMVSTDGTDSLQCGAWSLPTYADSDRLSYEQMTAGEPCRGCGQEVLPRGEAPSWVGMGTLFFTDEERTAHLAAEEAFKQRHPYCHALRWSMQGSSVTHCARCCPPPPMSPQQVHQVAQFLNDAAERRVRNARREGTRYERHELERRLPGRARSGAVALREYQQRRAAALQGVKAQDLVLLWSSFPEPDLMFRWRIQLDCGDIAEVLTLGDHRPPVEATWSWAGRRLRAGMYACADHKAGESPYRRVVRYVARSTLDLDGDAHLGRDPETVRYWTVQLECGHVDEQVTPLDWKSEDGRRQTAPNDPDEVARRKARMKQVKDCLSPGEYARALRQIEQGHLEPDPMTACWLCGYQRPIVAFQRAGWLLPAKPVSATPAPEPPAARPTRAQLEQRVTDLEAEVARLKGRDPG